MMKEFSSINERISHIIENQSDNNQKKFAEKIGFAPQVVYNIVSGRKSKPSFDVLSAVISSFDDISSEWLLTGEGEMLRNHGPDSTGTTPVAHRSTTDGIPLIHIDAMAGFGNGDVGVLDLECDRYVVPLFRDAEFLIQVRGSSMYPKYSSGDVVACKKLPLSDLFFQWNKVYVLDTSQGALIKRIKKGKAPSHILVVSDNPAYDQFELALDMIYSVAIVIGVIRLE